MLTRLYPALYDRQHSWNLTRNIYRFVPATIDQVKGFHTINEACVVLAQSGFVALSADLGSPPLSHVWRAGCIPMLT